jgi:hypothetical protein
MSYSYVKTVFPDYEYSNVYDEKLYSNLNGGPQVTQAKTQPSPQPFDGAFSLLKSEPKYDLGDNKLLEEFANQDVDKNNLHYYNIPISNNNIPKYVNVDYQNDNTGNNKISGIEKFGQNNDSQSHEEYIKHISNCSACKKIMLKQFNIESDRLRNEEIVELISYIMFGLFILILLDTLKK